MFLLLPCLPNLPFFEHTNTHEKFCRQKHTEHIHWDIVERWVHSKKRQANNYHRAKQKKARAPPDSPAPPPHPEGFWMGPSAATGDITPRASLNSRSSGTWWWWLWLGAFRYEDGQRPSQMGRAMGCSRCCCHHWLARPFRDWCFGLAVSWKFTSTLLYWAVTRIKPRGGRMNELYSAYILPGPVSKKTVFCRCEECVRQRLV